MRKYSSSKPTIHRVLRRANYTRSQSQRFYKAARRVAVRRAATRVVKMSSGAGAHMYNRDSKGRFS